MYKVNKVQVKPGKVIPEMILLEDQSQPLPSPSVSVASMDSQKILDSHVGSTSTERALCLQHIT
jgi:hypothetical protein